MEKKNALAALGALAQEKRLDIYRLLVQAGPEGLPAGRIGERLGIPSATLAFHLKELRTARLATYARNGRSLIYAAEYPVMNALLAYLTENCCGDPTSLCLPPFRPEISPSCGAPWKEDALALPEQPIETTEIKELVRARYGGIAAGAVASCCTPALSVDAAVSEVGEQAREMGYSAEDLAAVPDGANLGLGCGNPQTIAAMRPGEVVIDLGSGAGFDCLLAARQVGPGGHVIGIDMTHEMLKKARENAAKVSATNVEFRLGELEHLPVADNTADVILSNCVINLVPDKAQVFREAFRALKPGGRLAISDVVNVKPLTPDLASDRALLCGCVAGAVPSFEIEAWLQAAGFAAIRITVKPESRAMIASWAPGRAIEEFVASAVIEARKPDPDSGEVCCATTCRA